MRKLKLQVQMSVDGFISGMSSIFLSIPLRSERGWQYSKSWMAGVSLVLETSRAFSCGVVLLKYRRAT